MSDRTVLPLATGETLDSALSKSQIYLDYERAFTRGTGLPLALRAPDMFRVVQYPKAQANPFCALLGNSNRSCAACYALQQELEQAASLEPRSLKCFAGLCESAVPVRVGHNLIAFLHTGQVLLQLLTIFAGHLAACGGELVLRARDTDLPAVANARVLIASHHTEKLSLARVAQSVNVSANYFSKQFRAATGMTFVDYVARVRAEKAKNLLQNPNLRVSEIAFDVGFQSLSQFNRAFKRIAGESPRELRSKF